MSYAFFKIFEILKTTFTFCIGLLHFWGESEPRSGWPLLQLQTMGPDFNKTCRASLQAGLVRLPKSTPQAYFQGVILPRNEIRGGICLKLMYIFSFQLFISIFLSLFLHYLSPYCHPSVYGLGLANWQDLRKLKNNHKGK